MIYTQIAEELKELLGMKGSPVAVKLAKDVADIPAGYEKMPEKSRHCQFVQDARLKGTKGYATEAEHLCKGGAAVLGIEPMPENIATGQFYQKLGNFKTPEGALETMTAIPKVSDSYYATVYSPLESAEFEPDSVVFIVNPKQALRLSQAYLHEKGGRIAADYAAIQSVCADAVCAVKERGVLNMTLGCNGSRKNSGIADDEVIIGVPAKNLQAMVEALKIFQEKWG
ncbi:DUF169 domain-containing protein [Methanospirillum lacunae]|uniref:DUF169 domain-containing protein n=1 Tax=Methanospirillum lacunae TaxID=668570 RepID=A0A2V2N9A7_9EURY|nr:DUF169 domain-containing protein [Methanospirillum lacunae]PWR74236.1 hypothetical protein DK846_03550 [Methanospirillum lacunae]